ncbi:MAG: hypothetical protein JW940_23445, partial [Polyangiaceae bacterium]|nr:hypothetical protein [Polyangiaceae bacterium]
AATRPMAPTGGARWQLVATPRDFSRHHLLDVHIKPHRSRRLREHRICPIDYGDFGRLPAILDYLGTGQLELSLVAEVGPHGPFGEPGPPAHYRQVLVQNRGDDDLADVSVRVTHIEKAGVHDEPGFRLHRAYADRDPTSEDPGLGNIPKAARVKYNLGRLVKGEDAFGLDIVAARWPPSRINCVRDGESMKVQLRAFGNAVMSNPLHLGIVYHGGWVEDAEQMSRSNICIRELV